MELIIKHLWLFWKNYVSWKPWNKVCSLCISHKAALLLNLCLNCSALSLFHHLVFAYSKLVYYPRNVCQRDITVRAAPFLVFIGCGRKGGLFLSKYFGCPICISPTHQRLLTSAFSLWNCSNRQQYRFHQKIMLYIQRFQFKRKFSAKFEKWKLRWHWQNLLFARNLVTSHVQ